VTLLHDITSKLWQWKIIMNKLIFFLLTPQSYLKLNIPKLLDKIQLYININIVLQTLIYIFNDFYQKVSHETHKKI
jgi:hypothetical protein